MKRQMSEETALMRLADYCARAEHCSAELLTKLAQWQVNEDARMRIMRQLQERGYFDDERYARALVNDKLHYNKWGPRKIAQALWQKHIAEDTCRAVLDEVSTDDYVAVLRPLLRQKERSLRATDERDRQQRLVRMALSRGFTFDHIRQAMTVSDDLEAMADDADDYTDDTE